MHDHQIAGRNTQTHAAGVWHSWTLWDHGLIDTPGRHFINYDH